MAQDDTSRPTEDLTPKKESQPGSTAPSDEFKDYDKGRFINALGDKNKKLKEQEEKLKEYEEKERQRQEAQKQKELEALSETERLKRQNAETAKENFRLKMQMFVTSEIAKHGLQGNPIAEIAVETPWAIPAVKKHLSAEPTWEETEVAVKQYLPAYLETLKKPEDKKPEDTIIPEAEDEPPLDPERSPGDPGVVKKVWSRKAIANLDAAAYAKYKPAILQAMSEGRIVD